MYTESMKKLRSSWRWYLLGLLALANILTWYVVVRESRQGELTVAFLDVGQGDSIYIEAPNGNQMLIDGGPDKKVLRALGKVMPFYDRSLDIVAVSHPHKDHIAGLDEVLRRYEVGAAMSSGTEHKTAEYDLWKKTLEAKGVQEIFGRRGMRVHLGGGAELEVLLPNQDVTHEEPHDGMLVMQLRYGETAIMLTGDMEAALENYLIAFDGPKLKSNLLKVGHHGSRTSSSLAFVGHVSPEYAVIQSGKDDSYGHPHPETVGTFKRLNIPMLLNEQLGTIVVTSDGNRMSVEERATH